MTKERRKVLFIFILINTALLLSTFVFCVVFNPKSIIESGKTYTCVFQKLFNIYCPGCGGTRSVGYLLSLDFKNAFLFYPPIFVGILLILYFDILLLISFKKNTLSLLGKFKYFEFLLIPISIILTFALRNVFLYFGIDFLGDIIPY
jgi:hypothetical protein